MPELFDELVMIGPSPRYVDDEGYTGGFSKAQIHELLDSLEESVAVGWSRTDLRVGENRKKRFVGPDC